MNEALFKVIEKRYGTVASWALWKPAGDKPKSNMGNMDILSLDKNPELLTQLNPNVVMVGLNLSRSIKFERPFQNFHDNNPHGNDFKIRYAFENTQYYGAYMTDIIKNLEMVSSKEVLVYLKKHPEIIAQNITDFQEELELIGANKPVILAFGSDAYKILKENLDSSFYSYLVRLTHYSHQISKENYKKEVHEQITEETGSIISYSEFIDNFNLQVEYFLSKIVNVSLDSAEEKHLLKKLLKNVDRLHDSLSKLEK